MNDKKQRNAWDIWKIVILIMIIAEWIIIIFYSLYLSSEMNKMTENLSNCINKGFESYFTEETIENNSEIQETSLVEVEDTSEQIYEETEEITIDNIISTDPTETTEITQTKVETEPQLYGIYSISAEEREMLAQLLYLEAGSTSYECQHMVAAVIFNRLSQGWGNTMTEVIYAEGQFSPAYLIGTVTPSDIQYQIIDDITYNGHSYPSNLLCFRADYYFSDWGEPYTSIDNVYFSTL